MSTSYVRRILVRFTALCALTGLYSCGGATEAQTTGSQGPQGPAGPQGPQGPQGPAGPAGVSGFEVRSRPVTVAVGDSTTTFAQITCSAGKVGLGAGMNHVDSDLISATLTSFYPDLANHPSGNVWAFRLTNHNKTPVTVTLWLVCAAVGQ